MFFFATWAAWLNTCPLLPTLTPWNHSALDRVAWLPGLQGDFPVSLLWSRNALYLLTLPALGGLALCMAGRLGWLCRGLLALCCLVKLVMLGSDLAAVQPAHLLHLVLCVAWLAADRVPLSWTATVVAASWGEAVSWFGWSWLSGDSLQLQTGWSPALCVPLAVITLLIALVAPLLLLAGSSAGRVGRAALLFSHLLLWQAGSSGSSFWSASAEWRDWIWLGALACCPLPAAGQSLATAGPAAWSASLLLINLTASFWLPDLTLTAPRELPAAEGQLLLAQPGSSHGLLWTRRRSAWARLTRVRLRPSLRRGDPLARWMTRNASCLECPAAQSRLLEVAPSWNGGSSVQWLR